MLNRLFRPLDVDNSSCKNADCVASDIVGTHEQKNNFSEGMGPRALWKLPVCSLIYVRINVSGWFYATIQVISSFNFFWFRY